MDTDKKIIENIEEFETIAKQVEEVGDKFFSKIQELINKKRTLISDFKKIIDQNKIDKIKKEIS